MLVSLPHTQTLTDARGSTPSASSFQKLKSALGDGAGGSGAGNRGSLNLNRTSNEKDKEGKGNLTPEGPKASVSFKDRDDQSPSTAPQLGTHTHVPHMPPMARERSMSSQQQKSKRMSLGRPKTASSGAPLSEGAGKGGELPPAANEWLQEVEV